MRNNDVVRKFKLALVKAFFELAKQRSPQVDPMVALSDPATMRSLLMGYSEKVLKLEDQLAIAAPKIEALDRISTADGSLCVTDAAKNLQMRPKDLFLWLSTHKWIYRRTGGAGWLAYQDKIQQGVLEHKITTVRRSDGSEKMTEQVRVTPKGLTKLAGSILDNVAWSIWMVP